MDMDVDMAMDTEMDMDTDMGISEKKLLLDIGLLRYCARLILE